MFELIQLTERCFYIQSPAKIGLYRLDESEVCFIDSGNDKDAGRKLRQLLDKQGWKLRAIYNTHANADHIGGNRYLQAQTGCRIYAPGIDCAITRHPILEPAFLYGAYPPKDLRHKFLLAQESEAESLTDEVLPEGFEIIPLPGHFFDMVGFRTPDGVVFLKVKGMEARLFVPSHAAPTEDIAPLAQLNIDKVNEIAERVMALCAEPRCFEAILQQLFRDYALAMNFEQYVLVGSTLRSYLAWLRDTGRLVPVFEDGMLLWTRS